jgi:hypothetical protein
MEDFTKFRGNITKPYINCSISVAKDYQDEIDNANVALHTAMYCTSIPSLIFGFPLLYLVLKQSKHWFPTTIVCLQLLCSSSILLLAILHTADLDDYHRQIFDLCWQILVNLMFIGMSAEFVVAFQFWASTADYLKGKEASRKVTRVMFVSFAVFYCGEVAF